MKQLIFMLLAISSWAHAQFERYEPSVRTLKSIQFVAFERVANGTIVNIEARDRKGNPYFFATPDIEQQLTEDYILSSIEWCAAVSARKNVVGILHIGACLPQEISAPNYNYFIGTVEMKNSYLNLYFGKK